jgi:PKD repeat protein
MLGVNLSLSSTPASADTAPASPSEPETVSAAALPTAQMNGVAWAQVIVGNRVYVTGQFTQARPAGSALGVNETPRTNLLSYDLTTGQLNSWAPTINAPGYAIAGSADGSTIYVGGDFDQASGVSRSRIVAFDAQTGAVKTAFNPGANTTVRAIATSPSNNTVYYGGFFTTTGAGTGFTARSRMAAADGTTGALLPWAPATDREVVAMIVHPASGRVIVGGSFTTLNGSQARGSGSVDGVTGASMPWAANQTIQNYGDGVEVGSFTTDGTSIFGSGWTFLAGGGVGNLEGVFSANAMTGQINWINATRGDNYSIAYTNGVVYSVGHTHDAGMIQWNPQTPDPWQFQRTNAMNSTVSPTLTNAYGTNDLWDYFPGFKAAQPLHWLPTLTGGTYTGQGQAAWTVAANNDYVVQGGEFPKVNNIAQQGLVRFAKRTIAGSTVDEIQNYTELTPTITDAGGGTVRIAWKAAWDRDNAKIKVEVLRGATTATSTVLKTFETNGTTWWNRPPLSFYDTTAPAGSSQTYRIRVTDPYGNGYAGPPVTYTVPAGTPTPSTYADSVLQDKPSWEWRMGETSGTAARDRAGSNDLVLGSGVNRNQTSALLNEATDKGVNFPGTTSTSTVQGASPFWQLGPQVFSLETWFNTTTNNGGKLIGFGDSRTNRSDSDNTDRHIYMTNGGQLRFGVRPDMGTRQTIQSPSNYRDGQWHHVVGTLDGSGMKLYVDGNLVASNSAVIKAQVYQGYWRVGGDRLSSWPSAPNREAFTGRIDEVAVYPTALTLGRIRAHYLASGRNTNFPNITPTADFTASNTYLSAAFDGSTSADDDGTISNYQWDFGDSTTGSGVTPTHNYSVGGTYNVSLTVTDNRGGTNTITKPVTVQDPPPNILPTAAYTSSTLFHTASFNSTSSDSDGTIVSQGWDFGEPSSGANNTATGASASHTYAAAGTYNVTLTVTDNRGGVSTSTQPVTITDTYAADAFSRAVSNGFGSADVGGSWTLSGAATSFSVSGGAGRIAGAVNGNRSAFLTAVQQSDFDIKTDVSLNTASTGGGAYASIIGRRVSNGNDYRLKLRWVAGGTATIYLTRTLAGAETILSTVNVPAGQLTIAPGDVLRTRFQVIGNSPTTVKAKLWRANTQEPAAWTSTATDNTPAALQTTGDLGVLLFTSSSWTGTAPIMSVDNLSGGPDTGAPVNVPPVAAFSATPSHLTASFDSSATYDPDFGTIVSRSWDFGEPSSGANNTGTGASPSHTYATPGTYPVILTVTDNNGATNSVSHDVTVTNFAPVAGFTATTSNYTANLTSTSTDSDGTIASHAWDFGEPSSGSNTGTGASASHTYAAPGTYTVTLTVTDNDGAVNTISHDVAVSNLAPIADFTSSHQDLTATMTSTSTDPDGTIVSYLWTFPDGTSTDTNPVHPFAAAGTYPVSLTVTDNQGATGTVTHDVVVTDPPPNVGPTASYTSAISYTTVNFTSTSTDSDGTIVNTSWDFGDPTSGTNNTATGVSPQHVFTAAGTYAVTITTTDDDGAVGTFTGSVTVIAPPVELATDLFGRTVSNGLGSADLGGAWTLSGAATSFSVNGGVAKIVGAVGGNRAGYLGSIRQQDVNITADISLDQVANGGGVYVSVIGRRVSNNNDYRLKIRYMPNGTIVVYLVRTLAGVETILSTTNVPAGTITANPNDVLSVRFQVSGTTTTTVRAKVWRSNVAEPATWLATATETAPAALQAAGDEGVLLYTSGSWVGTPATLSLDNLHVTTIAG